MTDMAQTSESTQQELIRRHRAAALVIGGSFALTLALVGVALFWAESLRRPGDPSLAMALWIAILIFGLGSFALRRARFQPARLQDIAALRGLSGLLATLQGTTIQIALIGAAIALMGFVVMMISPTDNKYHMLRAGGVAAIILIYSYPRRTAWERLVKGMEASGSAETTPAKGIVA